MTDNRILDYALVMDYGYNYEHSIMLSSPKFDTFILNAMY